jgi:hypothetical protein
LQQIDQAWSFSAKLLKGSGSHKPSKFCAELRKNTHKRVVVLNLSIPKSTVETAQFVEQLETAITLHLDWSEQISKLALQPNAKAFIKADDINHLRGKYS